MNDSLSDLDVVKTDWSEVSLPFEILIWIFVVAFAEWAIHIIRNAHKLLHLIPETCYLIAIGMILGVFMDKIFDRGNLVEILDETVFFLVLLPPIIFDAGYNMPRFDFLNNIGSILVFALFNTLFNAVMIGGGLFLVYKWGWCDKIMTQFLDVQEVLPLDITNCLLFGSIISAVDPVAVIAVFDEIHVNAMLFICVFGESLLNDGVAVVLYQAFAELVTHTPESIDWSEIAFLVESFFYVAFGGILLGLIMAYMIVLVTKYWDQHLQFFEPAILYLGGYMAYLLGEYFEMSAILASVTCGFIMRPHVENNIHAESKFTMNMVTHFLSHVGEVSIFVWLGLVTVQSDWTKYFNWSISLWVLLFISIFRVIGIFGFGYFLNFFRDTPFSNNDMIVSSFGGLRGGIAFSLTALAPIIDVEIHNTLICTAIFIVLFTSFIQGILTEPLVKLLKIPLDVPNDGPTLHSKLMLLSAKNVRKSIESIIGIESRASKLNKIADWSEKKLWPILRKNNKMTISGFDRQNLMGIYKEAVFRETSDKMEEEIRQARETIRSRKSQRSQQLEGHINRAEEV